MIRPIRPIRTISVYASNMQLARSGPTNGALGRQLGALARRRRLRVQQQDLQRGVTDYLARPPYPFRPRPPS